MLRYPTKTITNKQWYTENSTASLLIVRSGHSTINLLRRIAKQTPMRRWALTMQIIEEITEKVNTQKWLQPFHQLMNEIYYPGYIETLEKEDPEAYSREYWYFVALYS